MVGLAWNNGLYWKNVRLCLVTQTFVLGVNKVNSAVARWSGGCPSGDGSATKLASADSAKVLYFFRCCGAASSNYDRKKAVWMMARNVSEKSLDAVTDVSTPLSMLSTQAL